MFVSKNHVQVVSGFSFSAECLAMHLPNKRLKVRFAPIVWSNILVKNVLLWFQVLKTQR
jgi:hypothetical protein